MDGSHSTPRLSPLETLSGHLLFHILDHLSRGCSAQLFQLSRTCGSWSGPHSPLWKHWSQQLPQECRLPAALMSCDVPCKSRYSAELSRRTFLGGMANVRVRSRGNQNVQVSVRIRPPKLPSGAPVVKVARGLLSCGRLPRQDSTQLRHVAVNPAHAAERESVYGFHSALPTACTQTKVFDVVGFEPVTRFLSGEDVCVYAYGQSGSGKTYTMYNSSDVEGNNEGLILRILRVLFASTNEDLQKGVLSGVSMSMASVELYCGHIRDLLGSQETTSKEFGINCALYHPVRTAEEAIDLVKRSERNRHVSSTNLNTVSSRGHCVSCITLSQKLARGQQKLSEFWLVDLGGLEKLRRSCAEGEAAREAAFINRSLSDLTRVVQCIAKGKSYVPFRDNALTMILKKPLSNNCYTKMVLTVSPDEEDRAETISSLLFGQTVQMVQCKYDKDPDDGLDPIAREIKSITASLSTLKAVLTMIHRDKMHADASFSRSKGCMRKIEDNELYARYKKRLEFLQGLECLESKSKDDSSSPPAGAAAAPA